MTDIDEINFTNRLVKKMYKKNVEKIISLNNLTYSFQPQRDLVVFDETSYSKTKNKIVVGGACIDQSDADIKNLAINFYLDVLMPINYAAINNIKCAIYVDTPVESCTSDFEIEKWKKFVDKLVLFLDKIAKKVGVEIKIIRRDKSYHLIDKLLENYSFTDEELKGLYDLVPSSKSIFFGPELLLHFRRSIVSYLPEFISLYFDEKIDDVIVCEELSQCKAIGKAKKISSNIYPRIYVDMPSLSCRNRMHRSNNGKLGIFESNLKIDSDPLFQQFIGKINLKSIFDAFDVENFWDLKNELKELWYEK
ncbi:hypothetical protein LRU_02068 [Ligilactobacillus ruminis SPM0211]|uniref:Uncharacterized protein n=1 Tax=Ligilactobacillus ruminis SPM0211 TaxID=1040964 RepID=F7R2W5_9LACO|nr:hypothetical protein [Ligilactobacillus ruminis]EGM50386.1 hypothetical protein LRU_02068 [Ligilactobacillus ruminis SPM0211]